MTFSVVIAGGENTGFNEVDNVEVADKNTNCKVERIPIQLSGAAGINGMICGGHDYNLNVLSSCWHLNPGGTWIAGEDMLERRHYFSLGKVEDEVIAIGGLKDHLIGLRSIEKYSLKKDEGWSRLNDGPNKIHFHCTVTLNTSYLMVIGGNQLYDILQG